MAAVEKIYGTKDQWEKLVIWLMGSAPYLIKYTNTMPIDKGPLGLFPEEAERWLIRYCPLEDICEEIVDNWDGYITPAGCLPAHMMVPTREEFKNFTLDEFNNFGNTVLSFRYRPSRDITFLTEEWKKLNTN
jgi:hypothetical protein